MQVEEKWINGGKVKKKMPPGNSFDFRQTVKITQCECLDAFLSVPNGGFQGISISQQSSLGFREIALVNIALTFPNQLNLDFSRYLDLSAAFDVVRRY